MRWATLAVDGHRLRYSVAGCGPALVLPKKDLADYAPTRLLTDRYTVVQVEPLGFCRSDRPPRYPPDAVPCQVLAVCDTESIDEFAVWGFSQGGAMACAVARTSPRARVLVCGGFNPLRGLSAAWLARVNRQQRVPLGSREFWNDFHRHDWHRELGRLEIPILVYAGTLDRQCLSRQESYAVRALGVEVITFDGLDHAQCGLRDPASPVTGDVIDWLVRQERGSDRASLDR